MTIFKRSLIALFVIFLTSAQAGENTTVLFIHPSRPESPFWSLFTSIMDASASQLNFSLKVKYGGGDRFSEREAIIDIVKSNARPDYLVFSAHTGGLDRILAACEIAKVYSIIVNTDILESDREKIGFPREKFKYWLGHISPDDVAAGKILSERLILAAKRKIKTRPIEVLAMSGARDSAVAFNRNLGMESSVTEATPNVILNQLLFPGWNGAEAKGRTTDLLKRYPNSSVLWAASDTNALGMVGAARELGYQPDVNVFIGGIDWSLNGLKAVREKELVATVGGHIFEGAWALVLLHDYLKGKDFVGSNGTTLKSKMLLIDQSNIAFWEDFILRKRWEQLDFRSFALARNAAKTKYDFSPDAVQKYLPASPRNR